jgi:hypothetical protein
MNKYAALNTWHRLLEVDVGDCLRPIIGMVLQRFPTVCLSYASISSSFTANATAWLVFLAPSLILAEQIYNRTARTEIPSSNAMRFGARPRASSWIH